MFFNEPVDLGVDWAASYIGDNPILRFVSIDNLKRGLVGEEAPTSVIWLGWSTNQGYYQPHLGRCWSTPRFPGVWSTSSSAFPRLRSCWWPPWLSFSLTGQNQKSSKPWSGSTARWAFLGLYFFSANFLGSIKFTVVTHSGKGIWYRHLHDADDKASHQYVLTGPQKLPWLPGQCGGFSKASSSSRRRRFRSKQQLLWLSTVRPEPGWTPEKCILVEDRWDWINLVANVHQGKMNQGCLWAHSYMKMLKRVK